MWKLNFNWPGPFPAACMVLNYAVALKAIVGHVCKVLKTFHRYKALKFKGSLLLRLPIRNTSSALFLRPPLLGNLRSNTCLP